MYSCLQIYPATSRIMYRTNGAATDLETPTIGGRL